MSTDNIYVQVLADYIYVDQEGREVKIRKGEELLIVEKSYGNWWQAVRNSETSPFYVPSCYVEIIDGESDNVSFEGDSRDENANVEKNIRQEDARSHSCDKTQLCESDSTSQSTDDLSSPHECLENGKQSMKRTGISLDFQNPLSSCDLDYFWSQDVTENVSCNQSARQSNSASRKDVKNDTALNQESSLPIYANIPFATNASPPNPGPYETPDRSLPNDWFEFTDKNGRKYYYHSPTRKVTWKPPRRSESISYAYVENNDKSPDSEPENAPKPPPKQLKPKLKKLAHSSSESLDSCASSSMFTILPQGWTQECDYGSGTVYYRNQTSCKKWYTSQDENGRPYFYDEDGSDSFWELPDLYQLHVQGSKPKGIGSTESLGFDVTDDTSLSATSNPPNPEIPLSLDSSPKLQIRKAPKLPFPRQFKTQSMVIPDNINVHNFDDERNLATCNIGCQLLAGTLNKTKLVEGGRRVRKNWANSYVILTDSFLLFYKDARIANSIPYPKPDVTIDLNGALVDLCPEKSSRKNVFQISTITGYQLLLQHDEAKEMKEWFGAIHNAILKLTSLERGSEVKTEEKEIPKHEIKLSRSKSTKPCHQLKNSPEEANVSIPAEKKKNIRDKLKNFFVRRPTMESLREKGIILDEPVFGCRLENLCQREGQKVPNFIRKCIEIIEQKELTADGLYRASGNLSQVQKIRFHVNQDDYKCLNEEDDVHVLTGALKMFFREMKEPLFPYNMFNKFLSAIALPDIQQRLSALRYLVHQMPEPNYETLKFLLRHLLKVTQFHRQNRMQVQNLAIVFGPTLMWPEEDSINIALDMMHQNRIVEFLLLEFHAVFK